MDRMAKRIESKAVDDAQSSSWHAGDEEKLGGICSAGRCIMGQSGERIVRIETAEGLDAGTREV